MREYSEHVKTFTDPGEIYSTSTPGEYVVHQQVPGHPWQLYLLRVEATGDERYTLLSDSEHSVTAAAVTGDGVAFYVAQEANESSALYRVPLDGSAAPELVHDAAGQPLVGRPYGGFKAGERTAVAGFMGVGEADDDVVRLYEIASQAGAAARPLSGQPNSAVVQDVWEAGDSRLAVITHRDDADPWRRYCQVIDRADNGGGGDVDGARPRKIGGEISATRDLHPAHRTATISPDGEELLYQREVGDWLRLCVRPVAGEDGELVATELNDGPGDLVGNWHPTDPNLLLITRFHGSQASIYRYHRESGECTPVPLPDGYNPHKICHGDGQFSQPRFTRDGKVVVLASSPMEGPHYVIVDPESPATPTLVDPLGGVRPPGPARRETAFTVSWTDDEPDPERNLGTLDIPVRYLEPANREKPKNGWRTVFLDNQGGPHLLNLANRHLLEDALLECGFALAVPEYPGREGYGTRYREALLRDPGRGEARSFDSVCGYLQTGGWVDPDGVGYQGWSWGGQLGALLAEYSHRFGAIVAGTPAVDQAVIHERTTSAIRRVTEHRFGGTPEDNPEAYARASAVACLPAEGASAWEKLRYRLEAPKASILYIPGKQDARFPDTTEEHFRRQKALGRDAHRYQMPGGHFNDVLEQQIAVLRITLGFFEEKLRPVKNWRVGARLIRDVSRAALPTSPHIQRRHAKRPASGRSRTTSKERR